MSRSRKKHPEYGYRCFGNAKKDKVTSNRLVRRKARNEIRNCQLNQELLENLIFKNPNEVHDTWDWTVEGPKGYSSVNAYAKKYGWEALQENKSMFPFPNLIYYSKEELQRNWGWRMYMK